MTAAPSRPPPLIEGDEAVKTTEPTKLAHVLEQTGLAKKKCDEISLATSKWFYIKHVGFNDIEISDGQDGNGVVAYYVDVKAKFAGWDVTLRRGGKNGEPILHLLKQVTFMRLLGWDKGSTVEVKDGSSKSIDASSKGSKDGGSNRSMASLTKAKSSKTRKSLEVAQRVEGEPANGDVIVPDMKDSEYAEMDDKQMSEMAAKKVTTITRKHAFKSNENAFEHDGREYSWNYWVFLGSALKLTDIETGEEIAVVQLLPTWKWQIITSWSWRLNGTLEVKEEGIRRGMQDIIMATLTAMLEWRKHNNKVWIIAAAAI